MTNPTPPGDMPLFEGLGSEWNDIVGAFPEDRRNELAPILKSRIDQYEPLKQWEDFSKSGVTPDHVGTALNLMSIIENKPREVYDIIGKSLGITPQQAQEVVEELEEQDGDDPRIASLQQQVETLAQIALMNRQQSMAQQQAEADDKRLNDELTNLKNKYGEVDEQQVLMYMLNNQGMTAEQAYQAYTERDNQIRSRRPSPMIMGSGGAVPRNAIDPTKLNGQDTRNLVAQMMQQGNNER